MTKGAAGATAARDTNAAPFVPVARHPSVVPRLVATIGVTRGTDTVGTSLDSRVVGDS